MAHDDPSAGDWLVLYGSLMRGLGAMDHVGVGAGLRFAGPCLFEGELVDLGDYPGLGRGHARVVGELYALLDPGIITALDVFEDFVPDRPDESLYLRERVRLIEPSNTTAWIYRYNRALDGAARIVSGDWRAHLAARAD